MKMLMLLPAFVIKVPLNMNRGQMLQWLVTDEWLFTSVIPIIRQRWMDDHRFCKVTALAKLWAEFDSIASSHLMTLAQRDQICNSFKATFPYVSEASNPVDKVVLRY